jgi:hypothetical protein
MMNRVILYTWATMSSMGAVGMGYKSHRLALSSYPPIQTWNKMSLLKQNIEYVRHGVVIGTGIFLGATMPPMYFLTSV